MRDYFITKQIPYSKKNGLKSLHSEIAQKLKRRQDERTRKKGWFHKAVDEYNKFCKELGLDKGSCRGCMPRIEFDDDGHVKREATRAAQNKRKQG